MIACDLCLTKERTGEAMSDIESTIKITSEHDCHWKDAFEKTGDELFEARKEQDELQSQLDALQRANDRLCNLEKGTQDHLKRVCEERDVLQAKAEESELLNECFSELFLSSLSDESNTGKVIRLQQAAQKIIFMNESDEHRKLVLAQFREWKKARAALDEGGDGG